MAENRCIYLISKKAFSKRSNEWFGGRPPVMIAARAKGKIFVHCGGLFDIWGGRYYHNGKEAPKIITKGELLYGSLDERESV